MKSREFLSSVPIGRRMFTEDRTEEITEIRFPESSGRLIAISQYKTCKSDEVEFYRVDNRGGVDKVLLRNKDGSRNSRIASEPGSKPHNILGNQLTYCGYVGSQTVSSCGSYIYDGKDLVQTAKPRGPETGKK